MTDFITIRGAREHNLKNVSLEIPRNKMSVFTGVSGSGKSSLAFDTIFAEGQRRYVESLSAYARQFLGQMQKPDVDEIEGLSPAISIDQKAHGANPRSTVATITEIYDYLRVLFARIGDPHCPNCGKRIQKMSVDEIVDEILSYDGQKPAESKKTSSFKTAIIFAPIVVGRKGEYYQMLYDMYNAGFMKARIDGVLRLLSNKIEINPRHRHTIELVIDTLYKDDFPKKLNRSSIQEERDKFQRLGEAVETALDYGNGVITVKFFDEKEHTFSARFSCSSCHFSFPEIEPRLFSFNSPYGACEACHGLGTESLFSETICKICQGKRLRRESLAVLINQKNIVDVTAMTIDEATEFFVTLKLAPKEAEISKSVMKEVLDRLQFMMDVGLEYLTLSRKAGTLSGGEAQRIRLASQVGSRLVGALYVLDEPTIGLHQHDNIRLVTTLKHLRDIGNTIIVVEHDEDTIRASDYLVDFGPGAGKHGGAIVCSGAMPEILKNKQSLTCAYLRGEKFIPVPKERRKNNLDRLTVVGARANNLKNITVDIPLRRFVCVTGVSGSGKSSLLYDSLYTNIVRRINRIKEPQKEVKEIKGVEYVNRAILIDQSPIGRTPRSNPATYTSTFTYIRDLFSATPEARFRNYKPGRFSFNVSGGRCENCEGHGYLEIEMHFLPTVYITCDICKGKRFNRETLEVHYKNKDIADVLEMTIEEAREFFKDIPAIGDRLKTLHEVGLGYIELGQPANTLSGGEAQRVKLSKELSRRGEDRTLYLFDEPTTGLHFEDVRQLLEVLQKIVKQGNTVLVIEHNLDVIKTADYIIDLGPGGGVDGGRVVAVGTPEDVARNEKSLTGKYLKKYL